MGRLRSQLAGEMGVQTLSSRPGRACECACPALGPSGPPPRLPGPPLVTWPSGPTGNSPREGGGRYLPRLAGRRGRVSAAPTAPAGP